MNQEVWGKCTWVLIHSIALNYPVNPSESEKENIIQFFTLLGDVLPCRYCRQHYRKNIQMLPINADSKMDLIWWTIDLHNMVNASLGKKELDRDTAFKLIIALYKKEPENPEGYLIIYAGVILLLFVGVWIIKKTRP